MKALIIVEDDTVSELIKYYIKPLGLDIIHYRDPIKALDNLEEIQPDAVVMSAKDFPRHWKAIAVDIRASKLKTDCAIILLKGDFFSFEEAAKASFLGINGVLKEDLTDKAEVSRFQSILKRYIDVDDSRSRRIAVKPSDRLGLLFTCPENSMLISGSIDNISVGGLSFIADQTAFVSELEPGTVIKDASIRVDGDIFSASLKLLRNGAAMAFSFEGNDELKGSLTKYLANKAARDIDILLNQ